jgi:hypothetical protein
LVFLGATSLFFEKDAHVQSRQKTFIWERLTAPPRKVPRSVQARIRFTEIKRAINLGSGFLGLWISGAGAMLIIFGLFWLNVATAEQRPTNGLYFIAGGTVVLLILATVLYRRGSRTIKVLRFGRLAEGTITRIWQNVGYHPYVSVIEPWKKLISPSNPMRESNPGMWPMMGMGLSQFRDLPCKVRIAGANGREQEIKARLDLLEHLALEGGAPRVQVFCAPAHVNDGIVAHQMYPWLKLSPHGDWSVEGSARLLVFVGSFLRAALPVVGMYISAALGAVLFGGVPVEIKVQGPPLSLAAMVLLLTVTHAVAAVFLFRFLLDFLAQFAVAIPSGPQGRVARVAIGGFRAWVWLFIGLWLGLPIVVLAYLTGWLSLVWAVFHVALARRGSRAWAFFEYGSTSTALLLIVVCFSAVRLFPLGIVVVLLQATLLAILELSARKPAC